MDGGELRAVQAPDGAGCAFASSSARGKAPHAALVPFRQSHGASRVCDVRRAKKNTVPTDARRGTSSLYPLPYPCMMPPSSSRQAQKSPSTGHKVNQVILGSLLFKTWYEALYPEELVAKDTDTLYVCDLSLFAEAILDQKSVCFDVSGFLFYLLVYIDPDNPDAHHILGYFSKEKMSWDANNLACILIFPPYQHNQLGKFLMGISYKLSTWEWERGIGSIGGPERPLSEMGERSYIRFWEERIARYFLRDLPRGNGKPAKSRPKKRKKVTQEQITIEELGKATGMLVEDVITAIKSMGVASEEQLKQRRKRAASENANEVEESVAVIKKSKVLEWAKNRGISLEDPVKDEGFTGKWALKREQEQSEPDND
ncbi:histone acetyltransferase ESA1 [Coccidioides immitis RMSCC 3703]|uniref:histone acetyltransferase n=1 Tax=Coccidioides immitis RMSCC 3703 TaxID=454286 RepID=A0A0J8TH52_COCIT|nr:histone acetyltransferase ESA1 [Coccidioides immitis RMSCC 3703]